MTTAEIAKRAGLSSSVMYTYFKDKEDLLREAILCMKYEHTELSTELTKKSVGLSDERFIELFYKTQAKIRGRVRFIINCMLIPDLEKLLEDIDFDYSEVFVPFLRSLPNDLATHTARALASISLGYFLIDNMDEAKATSLSVLRNARKQQGVNKEEFYNEKIG